MAASPLSAQVVAIPDPNFKDLLLAFYDMNGSGEIEVDEAQNITEILLSGNESITDLTGLEAFSNVTDLNLSDFSSVTTLPSLSNWAALEDIDIMFSGFTGPLDLSQCQLLRNVNITYNHFTSAQLNSPQLHTVNLMNNDLENIVVTGGTVNLMDLILQGNEFQALDEIQLDPATYHFNLNLNDNPLPAHLDLEGFLYHGYDFQVYYPSMTSFAWPAGMHENWDNYMSIGGPNLVFADFKNNYFDASWSVINPLEEHVINVLAPPSLAICVDDMDIGSDNPELFPPRSEALYFQMLESNAGNPVPFVSPYCDQISGSNTIVGTVQFNCGSNPSAVSLMPVNITGTAFNYGTATSAAGNYTLYAYEEEIAITPVLEHPDWFNITPPYYNFAFENTGNMIDADFCLTAVGVHPDLEVSIVPLVPARPGFDAVYSIVLRNKGNQVLSGSVSFNFDDAILDFVSATQSPDAQSSGSLAWDFANLSPFESRTVNVTLNVNAPTETPAVNIGDILVFSAQISPSPGDETPSNNTANLDQAVVGSFDPNDKQVIEGESVSITQSGEYLNYIVRFQNTGTFLAENVVIKDVLSDKLDVATLQVMGASHDFRTAISHERQVEFFFEGINLPASQDDEPASHGFVAFKVKPMGGVVVGDVVENTAEIYFDFNWPIITNTVSTEFTVLSVTHHQASTVSIVPNPASAYFTMGADGGPVTVSNMLGQKVASFTRANASGQYDISTLPPGTYIVSTQKGSARLVIR